MEVEEGAVQKDHGEKIRKKQCGLDIPTSHVRIYYVEKN